MSRIWLIAALCLASLPAPGTAQTESAAASFDPEHILAIDLRMAPAHWLEVRLSQRHTGDPAAGAATDAGYAYRPADLVLDGVTVGQVGARKKGFLGSVVSTRPSLKISFDEYAPGRRIGGVDGLTLNNNNQDQTRVQTQLMLDLFHRAGVPAPRANFAHVTVNGEDLGIYTHVEPVGRPFLRRVFGTDRGSLYESHAADLTAADRVLFEEKLPGTAVTRARFDQFIQLMDDPAPLRLSEVEARLDVPGFIRMWAVESLAGHWDSYSGNRNNFCVYVHPTTGLIHFIPSGPDAVFQDASESSVPKSFKATGIVARRLWQVPEIRARYQAVMRELLAGIWNESRLLADLAARQRTVAPYQTLHPDVVDRATRLMARFITTRRDAVEAELAGPAPAWAERTPPVAEERPMLLTGTFEAPWLDIDPADPLAPWGGGIAPMREGYQNVTLSGNAAGQFWRLSFTIDPFRFGRDVTLPVDLHTVWAVVSVRVPGRLLETYPFGTVGEVQILKADTKPNGIVSGAFTLRVQLGRTRP